MSEDKRRPHRGRRAKKKKAYEKGSIMIQVSASKGQIFYLEEDT